MELDAKTQTPRIRIGVLQHEEDMVFQASDDFVAFDLNGNPVFEGQANRAYTVRHKTVDPGEIHFVVRMNIRRTQEEADFKRREWQSAGQEAWLLQVGQVIPLGKDKFYDNREYWVLSQKFASEKEADDFRRTLPDFGGMKVVPVISRPASGKVLLEGAEAEGGIRLRLKNPDGRFILQNIRVGIGFHWEHRESQEFSEELAFHIDRKGLLTAVNILDLETYLSAVNSSEMVPDCSLEFLKSQTVVARNTVFATAGKHHFGDPFDLCADDHCQCFHGVAAIQERSRQAGAETRGEVLMYGSEVCDARYAKVCGGVGEAYHNVWDDLNVPYLTRFYDGPQTPKNLPDLHNEAGVEAFLADSPEVFCNPEAFPLPEYLRKAHEHFNRQVGYMPEASGFRWEVRMTPRELGAIVEEKTGWGLGAIWDIQPLERGDSGRIIYARLVGENGEKIIGKELEIRRVLSKSHLFSAMFIVKRELDEQGTVQALVLKGGGWGHGVGLCQVGAEIMGEEGYSYEQILTHYYPGAKLKRLY